MKSLDLLYHIVLENGLLNFTNDAEMKSTVSVSYHIYTCFHRWTCCRIAFNAQTWLSFSSLNCLESRQTSCLNACEGTKLMKHDNDFCSLFGYGIFYTHFSHIPVPYQKSEYPIQLINQNSILVSIKVEAK